MKYYVPERRTRQATIYNGKVSKRNNSDAKDVFPPMSGLFSCAVTSTYYEIFRNLIDVRCYYFPHIHASGMVIFDILDIRGHAKLKVYSDYHHAINGYWVVDNLGDSWSTRY